MPAGLQQARNLDRQLPQTHQDPQAFCAALGVGPFRVSLIQARELGILMLRHEGASRCRCLLLTVCALCALGRLSRLLSQPESHHPIPCYHQLPDGHGPRCGARSRARLLSNIHVVPAPEPHRVPALARTHRLMHDQLLIATLQGAANRRSRPNRVRPSGSPRL